MTARPSYFTFTSSPPPCPKQKNFSALEIVCGPTLTSWPPMSPPREPSLPAASRTPWTIAFARENSSSRRYNVAGVLRRTQRSRRASAVNRRPIHQASSAVLADARSLAGTDLGRFGGRAERHGAGRSLWPRPIACAFAQVAPHVTGIDLIPAMIDQAKALQQSHGLANLTWRIGRVLPLPFPTHHSRWYSPAIRFTTSSTRRRF
jgi:hypothetical protein